MIEWIVSNPEAVAAVVGAGLAVARRVWPTKDTDGLVTKCGKWLDRFFARLPNRLK